MGGGAGGGYCYGVRGVPIDKEIGMETYTGGEIGMETCTGEGYCCGLGMYL